MTHEATHPIDGNPFATKFIRAGTMQFRFLPGDSLALTQHRLRRSNWRGQIVGPHGAGKTTLLHTLHHHWHVWGRTPRSVTLHNRQRSLPDLNWRDWTDTTQLIVDGFEQLSPLAKLNLLFRCRIKRSGLLVTTHNTSPLLPVVQVNRTSIELARSLVGELTGGRSKLETHLVERAYKLNAGNLREMFLSLYDEYQAGSSRRTKMA